MSELPGWVQGTFTAEGASYPTYRKGSGPAVIVIHEIPGITDAVLGFAEEVVDAGFTVVMPSILGTPPGIKKDLPNTLSTLRRICVSKEFTVWALNSTSPITSWLRALARDLHAECGGPGVGAVGMCFSGGFALAMMVDGHVAAPVLSQPASPFPVGKARAADLNLSRADLASVKARVADGCQVLGLRYTGDRAVGTRFETLRRELGDGFLAVELPGNKHSVLTDHRDDASVARVLAFFAEKLKP